MKTSSKVFNVVTIVLSSVIYSHTVVASDMFIQKQSPYGVSETLDRLEAVLKQKGITVFARVDHAAGARKVGQTMSDTQLLIFGNPKMGTPLMKEQRLMGLDLPMKVLAWESSNNQTWIAYTSPDELKDRHQLKNEKIINKMKKALNAMTNKAVE